MNNLTIEQINNFAQKKNVNLNSQELEFTYNFVKKNWHSVLGNPNLLNLDRYQEIYSKENFEKIKQIFNEYSQKYKRFF